MRGKRSACAGPALPPAERVRADTTVVEADVTYPTDSGLLTRAIGKAARLVKRIKGAGADTEGGAAAAKTRELIYSTQANPFTETSG